MLGELGAGFDAPVGEGHGLAMNEFGEIAGNDFTFGDIGEVMKHVIISYVVLI